MMRIRTVTTRRVIAAGDPLSAVFSRLPRLNEKSLVVVSSKVISLVENRIISKAGGKSRDLLIMSEADAYVPRHFVPRGQAILVVKQNALTVAAGIDEFDGSYLLWPRNPEASARRIWDFLREKYKLRNLGVIITDSHTVPLRRGIVGFALGYWGFRPLRSYRGRKNLFGRTMKMTQANIADALAAAAVMAMGEGGERTPVAVVNGLADVVFTGRQYRPQNPIERFFVSTSEDIFRPLLTGKVWKKKMPRK